jgi:hypothetical protein
MAVFAALVVLYLQRSASPDPPQDRIYHYAPPALGCAASNYVGNLGVTSGRMDLQLFAGVILGASVVYIFHILRPFGARGKQP